MFDKNFITFYMALGGLGLYGAFLPPVSELARNFQTQDEKAVIRETEMIGTVYLLIVAAVSSKFAGSWLPLVLASAMAASMYGIYEYALQRVPVDKE